MNPLSPPPPLRQPAETASTRYIFITGGVVSSLGKGVCAAAIAALLQASGARVTLRKLDPYLNIDPGTMSPIQHGEVFITDDGAETDLDLGHYERFTGISFSKNDNVTAGQIYAKLLAKERRGDYLGATVQVIPHVTDMIKEFITQKNGSYDIAICEIGGTVGDIESLPFLEAIRQLRFEKHPHETLFIHLTLLPWIQAAGELKTKPTQHSVKELQSVGIQPDILLCRTEKHQKMSDEERNKIALFCNLPRAHVILAPDMESIYDVPLGYHEQKLDGVILQQLQWKAKQAIDLTPWHHLHKQLHHPEKHVSIAVIGKYTTIVDSYKSLTEALTHGASVLKSAVHIKWIDAEDMMASDSPEHYFDDIGGILVPGGFGVRGSEGKMFAAQYARRHNIPFFGICLGMQMAVIEFAKNVARIKHAASSEFETCENPVVGLISEWSDAKGKKFKADKNGHLGGTMRLGAYPCDLTEKSRAYAIYQKNRISERHRHRYEVNVHYKEQLHRAGMHISGISPDGNLPEIIELPAHPWFIGVQFHPEIKSRPLDPHPLFVSFIDASLRHNLLL